MTAHVVVASDEFDGIALTCLGCDDFNPRGFGHSETAWPVARLHEAEERIEQFDGWLRAHVEQAAVAARSFPPAGGHYAAGYAADARDVLAVWDDADKQRRVA